MVGRARLDDSRIDLTVDLVEVETGAILWTEERRENLADFFNIISALTERIVQSVLFKLPRQRSGVSWVCRSTGYLRGSSIMLVFTMHSGLTQVAPNARAGAFPRRP